MCKKMKILVAPLLLAACLLASCSRHSISEDELHDTFAALSLDGSASDLLASYQNLTAAGGTDSIATLLQSNRFAFQHILSKLIKHGLFLRYRAQNDSAAIKIGTARKIAQDYAEALGDTFFVRTVDYANKLRDDVLRKKLEAHALYGKMWHFFDARKEYERSDWCYRAALRVSREIGDEALVLDLLNLKQYINYYRDDNKAVIEMHDEIFRLAEKTGYLRRQISTYYNTGMSLINRGLASEALAHLQQGLALAEQTHDQQYIMMLAGKIGNACRQLGRFPEADEAYSRALNLARKRHDVKEELLALNDASQMLVNQGLYSRARQDLLYACKLASEQEEYTNKFIILFNLADLSRLLGDFPRAFAYLDSARALLERHPIETYELARFHQTFGNVYHAMDDIENAIQHYREAVDIVDTVIEGGAANAPRALRAKLWLSLSENYARQRQIDMAFRYSQMALNAFNELEHKIEIVNAQRQLGTVFTARQDFDQALNFFNKSRQNAEALNDPWLLLEAYYNLALVYKEMGDLAQAERHLTEAIDKIESTREKISSNERMSYFATMKNIYDEMVLLHFEQADFEEAFAWSEQVRARFIRELYQQKYGQSGVATNGAADKAGDGWHLDDRIQLIEYQVTAEKLLIFTMNRGNLHGRTVDISRADLEQAVNRFRASIGAEAYDAFRKRSNTDNAGAFHAALQHATRLYRLLIEPVQAQLDPAKVLYIVPDEILFQLPFAALTESGGRQDRFLIEKYTLATIQSLHLLNDIIKTRKSVLVLDSVNILAVGNPTGDLPEAEKEVRDLKDAFPQTQTLLKNAASEQAVMRILQQNSFDILHIASHAKIDQSFPFDSYLALCGVARDGDLSENRSVETEYKDASDGYFTAREIAGLSLSHLRLANLAACKTAGGRFLRGEGVVGLSWALMNAGVSAVVSSLWDVDDRYTRELMLAFYRSWLLQGANKAEALRQAQLQIIEQMRADKLSDNVPQPYSWAPFILIGDYATR